MNQDHDFQFIRLEVDREQVAWLTLNRSDKHNAFNEHVIAELNSALETIAQTANMLILQAEGKSFSAGADLDWMQRMANFDFDENVQDANGLAVMLHRLYTLPMPTIAKVQGSAYGGGVGLVACCDLVVASEAAQFCLSEVKLGLIPATISPYVVNAVGASTAKRLFITAEVFAAQQARHWGLVTEVAASEQLDASVEEFRRRLLKNSPAAMTAAKFLVDEVKDKVIDQSLLDLTSRRIAEARTSPDGREGVKAFLDKRPPRWQ